MHRKLIRLSTVLVPVLGTVFYRFIILPPKSWAKGTGGNLLGEVYIRTKQDAYDFADMAVHEGYSLWDEPSSNWQVMHNSSQLSGGGQKYHTLVVESRRITEGPMAGSNILLTRSSGTIPGADPDEVYNFFISPEGIQLLDETMDPEKVPKYIERYPWKGAGKDARLDVHESFNPMPQGIADRYHIVLNGYRTKERFFFCKSIVHDSRPGSSVYYKEKDLSTVNANDSRVRAVNTFYFHIKPTEDGSRGSVVRMVNFVDFRMGSTLMNWLIAKAFFPGVYSRIQKKFGIENEVE